MHIQNPYTHAQPHIPNPHCKWLTEKLRTALNLHDEWGDLSILEHTNSSGAILYTDIGCFGGLGFLEASNPWAPSGKEKEPCLWDCTFLQHAALPRTLFSFFFPIENNAPIERICLCSTRAALHRTLTFSQCFQYGSMETVLSDSWKHIAFCLELYFVKVCYAFP